MIQFNLIPAIKEQYLRTRRKKRLVSFVAIIVSAASLLIFIILFVTVGVVQKKSLSDVSADVDTNQSKLESVPDLKHVLTIQNQLSTIGSLHDKKPVTTRLFSFLSTLIPSQVTVSSLNVDYTQNVMIITGEAPSIDHVYAFVKTLKQTQFTTSQEGSTPAAAFDSVVLSSFGRDSSSATYTITIEYKPDIFSRDYDSVKLSVAGAKQDKKKLFKNQAPPIDNDGANRN